MGLLDSILSSVLGGGANSPMGGVLGQILGGGSGGVGGGGGLGGLLGQLRQSGLGSQVDSWVGPGQNQPVSPQQLNHAFGDQQVNSWAGQAGMQPHDFLSRLTQHLPNAVDQMTPDGRLPDEGTVSV
jgi:uncharacterized protein YidB (DUF937 family)